MILRKDATPRPRSPMAVCMCGRARPCTSSQVRGEARRLGLRRGKWSAQLAECPFSAIEKLAPLRILAKDQGSGSIPRELRFPLLDQRLASRANHNGLPAGLQINRIG